MELFVKIDFFLPWNCYPPVPLPLPFYLRTSPRRLEDVSILQQINNEAKQSRHRAMDDNE